jgi:hypothetical protein
MCKDNKFDYRNEVIYFKSIPDRTIDTLKITFHNLRSDIDDGYNTHKFSMHAPSLTCKNPMYETFLLNGSLNDQTVFFSV